MRYYGLWKSGFGDLAEKCVLDFGDRPSGLKISSSCSKYGTCTPKAAGQRDSGAYSDDLMMSTRTQLTEKITTYKTEHLPSKQMAVGSSPTAPSTFQSLTDPSTPSTPCFSEAAARIMVTYCSPGDLRRVTHECPHCGGVCDCEWGTEDEDHCEHICHPEDDDEEDE